ncbi:MAG: type II toxin-antitoxin system HicA family toxin [Planctomycetota bacterium]
MGERFPAVTGKQIIRLIRKIGFEFYRSAKGSHEVWRRPRDGRHTIIPRHAGKIIKRKTLKSIINDTGLTIEEFRNLL